MKRETGIRVVRLIMTLFLMSAITGCGVRGAAAGGMPQNLGMADKGYRSILSGQIYAVWNQIREGGKMNLAEVSEVEGESGGEEDHLSGEAIQTEKVPQSEEVTKPGETPLELPVDAFGRTDDSQLSPRQQAAVNAGYHIVTQWNGSYVVMVHDGEDGWELIDGYLNALGLEGVGGGGGYINILEDQYMYYVDKVQLHTSGYGSNDLENPKDVWED